MSTPIESLLDRLERLLKKNEVEAFQKRRVLGEVRDHLQQAVIDEQKRGSSIHSAERTAVSNFGSPAEFVRLLSRSKPSGLPPTHIAFSSAGSQSPELPRSRAALPAPPELTNSRIRQYSPLTIALVAALLLAVVLLPSGLNTPQSTPNTVPEFAPVPPDEDNPPSDESNLGALGQARGSSLSRGGGLLEAPLEMPSVSGRRRSGKRCVGKPPRQTEDPLSPPCVAFFEGDNGGATYRGVTRDEIRILFYINGGTYAGNSRGTSAMPPGTYWDLARPPRDDDPLFVVLLRVYQSYFNDRFQTYNRFVHFYVRFSNPVGSNTAESRTADAADDFATINPAAVVLYVQDQSPPYVDQMGRRGVIVFLGNGGGGGITAATERAATFSRYSPRLWGYYPSAEQRARIFVSYVCSKVVPHPVSFSGSISDNDGPRRLGLLREGDQGKSDRIAFDHLVKEGVEACGGRFEAEGYVSDVVGADAARASSEIAAFIQNGVTTIIRSGGNTDLYHARAASGARYYPEWIVAGNGLSDSNLNSQTQDQSQWRQARAVSHYHLGVPVEAQHCYTAAQETDPSLTRIDLKNWSCGFYPGLRMLFTGIQVAGPRFGATSVDRGFHSIPAVRSNDPEVPACYYDPGDYTCVKDAVAEWWDTAGQDPGSSAAGCWRVMEGGRRYPAGTWKTDNVDAQRSPSDPCNFQGVGAT